jgi:uncharacterized protein
MLLSYLADRFVLQPSRHELPAIGKSRRLIPWANGHIEVWRERTLGERSDTGFGPDPHEPACFVLKFNGKEGRAERTGIDPLDHWSDLPGEVWSVNPPGYGGSSGRATLRSLVPAAERVLDDLLDVAAGRPILLAGSSLGSLSALYLAARYADEPSIAGLILHNPPPLRQLMGQHYLLLSLGLSRWLARRVPAELDCLANAGRIDLPAVVLTSAADEMVPPQYQQMVVDCYAGPLRHVVLPGASHVIRFTRKARDSYGQALHWLRQQIGELALPAHLVGEPVLPFLEA